ncbi:MAG TPA: alpha/beta hydrolase [Anaeromyxobacter sp.]|nr:alpha/beta hydrolase [Anaeromyxobacter sp.]
MADARASGGRDLLPGFTDERVRAGGVSLHVRRGGTGPPLLLLHGYPQTVAMWHRIAAPLARRFTVVLADLRGYGDSDKPATAPDHAPYAKRAMAGDMLALMRGLGFERFRLVGHDRGGRVAHRLALDAPDAVERLAVLDIAPTLDMYEQTTMDFARAYFHWFFLIQPEPLPERLIGAERELFLRTKLRDWSAGRWPFDDAAFAEYLRCFGPETIHASCEDYRAAASIDLEHDRADRAAGRRIRCPVLALWGERGRVHALFRPLEAWRKASTASVEGRALPCGHFLAEEVPDETLAELERFLTHP